MRTLVQKVFGNSINSEIQALAAFPDSRLMEVSRELHRKLELKREAEMTDDEKIARDIAALRAKNRASQRT
jgi:hypothetical protein